MAISVPPKGDSDKKIGAQFAPLSVTPQDTPNMTVKIRAGLYYNTEGTVMEHPGGSSPVVSLPGSNNKWVIVGLNNSGSVTLTHGTSAPSPVLPALPAGTFPLAFLYVSSTTTALTTNIVFDARPVFRAVDAVPDIAAELADRPTFADMNAALDDKADIDGTPNSQFYLSKGAVAPANALLSVDRGASVDVSIRWNEITDTWQFTNDGVMFVDIASVSGSFIPVIAAPTAGNVPTITVSGTLIDSGQSLTGLATDAEVTAALTTKLDDFVGVNSNVVVVAGLGTALADGGIALSALATDAELAAGLALKANLTGATFTGTVTVQTAGNQPIALVSTSPTDSAVLVNRSGVPGPNALLEWDETTEQWLAGVIGAAFPILTSENLALTDLTDVTLTAPAANNVLQFNGAQWVNTAKVTLAAGTALLPAYTFASDATKGMYDSGAGEVSFAIAGAQKVRINAGGITTFSGYASATPGMTLWNTADPTTGISFSPPGIMTMVVAGVPVATFGGPPGPTTALTAAAIGMTVQAFDLDLSAVAAMAAGDGFVQRTAGVWSAAALSGAQVNTALGYTAANAASVVPNTRNVDTTVGELTGGGALSANLTLGLATAGTAGTYDRVTTDSKGRVTSGATQLVKGFLAFAFGAILAGDTGDSTNDLDLTALVPNDPQGGDVVTLGMPPFGSAPTGFTYQGFVDTTGHIKVRAANVGTGGVGAGAANVSLGVLVTLLANV